MYQGKIIFSQIMDHLPIHTFSRKVQQYQGNRYVKNFSCLDQYLCMAFAQLTFRESLRDIEACLRAQRSKLFHMGIRGKVSRSTLADANERRDWRIYADIAMALIDIARPLYVGEDLGLELDNTVYALDATTIDLCLTMFPWAHFRRTKAAVKLHTLLDLRGNIPTFIHITDGKTHDVNVLDILLPEAGAFYVMDRGYIDFERLFELNCTGAFFITRAKSNFQYRRRYSLKVDKTTGLLCDQVIVLTGSDTVLKYPQVLRRIKYRDPETGKLFVFLTNNFIVSAFTITQLYHYRWQIELFFKWIKQHLRIKSFFGTSENAVKSQIWIAISVYVLIAIIKKRLAITSNLYTILQILSVTMFERIPLIQVVTESNYKNKPSNPFNQLNLFDNLTGH